MIKQRKDWLILLREQNHLSQKEAAELAHMDQRHLNTLENTTMIPSILDSVVLADLYHVNIRYFYTNAKEDYEKRPKKPKRPIVPRTWLTQLREERNLSKKGVSDATGLSEHTIIRIERGYKCTPESAKKLADLLDFDENKLLK
jgi:transcriptional regulator with XRE-family HTH domain